MAVESWSDAEDLDGIIGTTCSGPCVNVGLLASAWNIPMISPSCMIEVMSNKNTYPTFARTMEPFNTYSIVVDAAIEFFG